MAMEMFVRFLSKLLRVNLKVVAALCRRLPIIPSITSVFNLYIFLQALCMLMLLLTSTLASMSVHIGRAAFSDDAPPLDAEAAARRLASGLVYACALRTLFGLGLGLWAVAWEMYYDFPTIRRMLMGPPGQAQKDRGSPAPQAPDAVADSVKAGEKAVQAAALLAIDVNSDGSSSSESSPPDATESPPGSASVKRRMLMRSKSGSSSDDPAAHLREQRRRIVLTTPLVVLTCAHLVVLFGERWCEAFPDRCDVRSGLFISTARPSKVVRSALFAAQLQVLIAWISFFPKWHATFSSAGCNRSLLVHVLARTLQLFLVPSLVLQGVTWFAGSAAVGPVLAAWSLWFLLAAFPIMHPLNASRAGFSFKSIICDDSWKSFSFLFKLGGALWCFISFGRECLTNGTTSAHKDMITMALAYPMLWCVMWVITYMAVAGLRCGRSFWALLAVVAALSVNVAWCLCAAAGRSDLPLLVSLVWLSLFQTGYSMLRRWRLRQLSSAPATPAARQKRRPTIKFALLATCESHERRIVGGTARVLLGGAAAFCLVLVLCVLLASRQQRSASTTSGHVAWHAAAGVVEISRAGVPTLRLGRRSGTAPAPAAPDTDADDSEDPAFFTLQPGERPRYAACGYQWHGLDLKDFAMLSKVAYMTPGEVNDMPGLLRELLPGKNVTIKHTASAHRKWVELEVESCAWEPRLKSIVCREATVIAVSGTDPSNVQDILENIRMWTEPVMMEIFSVVFPIVRAWSRDTMAMLIGGIHRVIKWMDLQDDQWHYREILDHVREIPSDREVVVTGHSLGGGIALVVGALSGRQAVAIQPPGLYHALAKHQEQHSAVGFGRDLHQSSVSLVVETDFISGFDRHGGLKQTITCDRAAGGSALGCHSLEGTICHMLRHCGDQDAHFTTCRHEF